MDAAPPPRARLQRRRSYWFLRYGCLSVLVVFFFCCLACSGLFAGTTFAGGPAVFLLATFLATATAVPYFIVLLWFDRNEREPTYLIATAFMWGATVATTLSLVGNTSFGLVMQGWLRNAALANQATASFAAPFFEELTKGAAVFLIFLLFKREFDNVLDGILYGALVGLGFAWFENILYYVSASEGGPEGMLKLTFLRGVMNGVTSHVAYTGLTGLGFGIVRVLRRGILRWAFVPMFWGTAMFAHFLWNTFVNVFVGITGQHSEAGVLLISIPLAILVLQLPFVFLLLLVVLFVWRHENRIIRLHLEGEPKDVVLPVEAQRLVPARRRLWTGIRRFFTRGPLFWWRARSLDHDLIRLAFLKWHHH